MAKFYQVGGSVRDELLSIESKDIDYAVEAESFDAMREAILQRGGDVFLETPKFFTIRARVPELGSCDFVLCRKDGAYTDGRRPETVEVGTILDDLARRDFTVNAIAKLEGEERVFLDPHNGIVDLKSRIIRCVGDPRDRFTEDGLRMIRALRFGVTKGLDLDHSIETLIDDEEFFVPRLKGVSIERIREELTKMFSHDTNEAFLALIYFPNLRRYLLSLPGLWLKPTTEER